MRDVTVGNRKKNLSLKTRRKISERFRDRPPMSEETHWKFIEFKKKYRKMPDTVIIVSDSD